MATITSECGDRKSVHIKGDSAVNSDISDVAVAESSATKGSTRGSTAPSSRYEAIEKAEHGAARLKAKCPRGGQLPPGCCRPATLAAHTQRDVIELVPPQALRASQAANAIDLDAQRGGVLGVPHTLLGVYAQPRTAQRLPPFAEEALCHLRQSTGARWDCREGHAIVHDHSFNVPRSGKGGAPSDLGFRLEGHAGILEDALVRTHADINCINVPHDHRGIERHHPSSGLGGLSPLGAKALHERLRRHCAFEVTEGALHRHRIGEGALVRDYEGGEHIRQIVAANAQFLAGPELKLQEERARGHVLRGPTQVKLPSISPPAVGDDTVGGLVFRNSNVLKTVGDLRRERQGKLATDVPAATVFDHLRVGLQRRVRRRLFPNAPGQFQQARVLPARGLENGKKARQIEP